jgi:Raf kinase inhibitor-like YbhB/YbcL family protein
MNTTLKAGLFACTALLASCAPTAMQATTIGTTDAAPGRLSVAQPASGITAGALTLSSPQFVNGGTLPLEQVGSGNGCTGMNVSPALNWTGVPAGTVSLVQTTYDPDAPTGSGFWHWVNYNIPASATGLAKGAGSMGGTLPAGAASANNDGGMTGYTGACPPVGDAPHRYVFTLYALSKTLDLPAGASPAYVGFNLNGSTLAKTSIVATYGR